MELKGSRTERCLQDAFSGESQARNKYTFFASIAKKAGFEQIAALLLETADNEKEHAERIYKFLGYLSDTSTNLADAAAGEHYEHSTMYPDFEKIAIEEGFTDIATFFHEVAEVEEEHERRFLKLKQNVDQGMVFRSVTPTKWRCRNCGYVHEGTDAPAICPACLHPQAYYELLAENY